MTLNTTAPEGKLKKNPTPPPLQNRAQKYFEEKSLPVLSRRDPETTEISRNTNLDRMPRFTA